MHKLPFHLKLKKSPPIYLFIYVYIYLCIHLSNYINIYLPCEDVWVVCPAEGLLQLVELDGGEGCAVAALLPTLHAVLMVRTLKYEMK